jgi:hypothetical protein
VLDVILGADGKRFDLTLLSAGAGKFFLFLPLVLIGDNESSSLDENEASNVSLVLENIFAQSFVICVGACFLFFALVFG